MSIVGVPLIDTFGRTASDLRISLTDRCSLRCTYCMPAEGLNWMPNAEMLTDPEVLRLADLFIRLGVRSIRLTGGEPLLHRSLVSLVASLAALTPRPELSLTTNGLGLSKNAEALVRAGLDRINVSVDTLDRERFRELTRRDRLADVLAGLQAAARAGLAPIKVNAVLLRESNLDEAPDLLLWALRDGYQIRFIEHMPLDAQHAWSRADMVTAEEMLAILGTRFTLKPVGRDGPTAHAPAEEFEVIDGPDRPSWRTNPARVGVIASVTRPFCRECDRLRLTSDGQLRTCLFAQAETDLRGPLRDGAEDAELERIIRQAVAGKQAGHGIDAQGFVQPVRPMSAIGG